MAHYSYLIYKKFKELREPRRVLKPQEPLRTIRELSSHMKNGIFIRGVIRTVTLFFLQFWVIFDTCNRLFCGVWIILCCWGNELSDYVIWSLVLLFIWWHSDELFLWLYTMIHGNVNLNTCWCYEVQKIIVIYEIASIMF